MSPFNISKYFCYDGAVSWKIWNILMVTEAKKYISTLYYVTAWSQYLNVTGRKICWKQWQSYRLLSQERLKWDAKWSLWKMCATCCQKNSWLNVSKIQDHTQIGLNNLKNDKTLNLYFHALAWLLLVAKMYVYTAG